MADAEKKIPPLAQVKAPPVERLRVNVATTPDGRGATDETDEATTVDGTELDEFEKICALAPIRAMAPQIKDENLMAVRRGLKRVSRVMWSVYSR